MDNVAQISPGNPIRLAQFSVGINRQANVFYNTGHGHLGWTLSAVTADMVGDVVQGAFPSGIQMGTTTPSPAFHTLSNTTAMP